MMNPRILIVDDEPSIVKMLHMVLQKEGFEQIYTAGSCRAALDALDRHGADIVLLDVMLPDGSGFELISQIRTRGNPHVFFLTAKVSDLDKLTGFAMGGDDYITKPFNPLEIAARIKARLRRTDSSAVAGLPASPSSSSPSYDFGRFRLFEASGELYVGDALVSCPAQVFQLLLYFCKHPGILFSKTQLYEAVWGIDGFGDDNTVTVHIRRIRERIEADPSAPKHLVTVRGLGYKLSKEYLRR
ncbi:response regulator transcription factor [Cohnella faecalis]|uniref:DNA-binding response regulator n=1 Tax=Cohnella faecalis TaxID=2315694 RepID=A0A398CND2_9BACL|nr:response regulator transcription factor [Cohnella faecalis]RIE01091.1 DNA-binding response regulator [Cohnella faecalis]